MDEANCVGQLFLLGTTGWRRSELACTTCSPYSRCTVSVCLPPPKCRQEHVHSQILRLERADAEVAYRALVGLGNVVS